MGLEILYFRDAPLLVVIDQLDFVSHKAETPTVRSDLLYLAVRRVDADNFGAVPFPVFARGRLPDIVIFTTHTLSVTLNGKQGSVKGLDPFPVRM